MQIFHHTFVTLLQQKFGRVTNDSEAFKAFKAAKALTIENNQKFQQGQVSFRTTLNKFASLPANKRSFDSGFRPTSAGLDGRSVTIINQNQYPPGPPSFDWRDRNAVTSVKDQSFFCNCCWAFSALAALESQFIIKKGRNLSLSEQNLIDCNRNVYTGNWGCSGGSQSSAFSYIKDFGIETSETYPYAEEYMHEEPFPCKFNSSNSVGKITGYYRLRPKNETLLRDVVAAVGPVAFAFCATLDSFIYYDQGVYDDPKCKR